MRIKSYYSSSVELAVGMARRELGDEAMLLTSRKTLPEARHLGEYEVVFASEAEDAPKRDTVERQAPPQSSEGSMQLLLGEISELRGQMERMSSRLSRWPSGNAGSINSALAILIESGIDPALAENICERAEVSGPPAPTTVSQRIRKAVEDLCRIDSDLGAPSTRRRALVLVGPPGVGKTTTLVKLACRYGLASSRSTQFLTLDTDRIAGAEQLHTLAAILGATCQTIDSFDKLPGILKQLDKDGLVLIDTPGFAAKDKVRATELARNLHATGGDVDIDVHLVLAASMNPVDLSRTVDRFSPLRPSKLIFTRLDETRCYGPILNESNRTGLPVSFLSAGPEIPDDLEPASATRLAELILGDRLPRAASATA